MTTRRTNLRLLHLLLLAGLCCTSLIAQEKSPRDRLAAAHGLYYNPAASGLQSFRCDASIDWKAMMTQAGAEVTDDDPALKYLQTVHLSVSDDLRGKALLEWTSSAAPPEGKGEAIKKIQNGLQTTVGGFFQSWNPFVDGSMVPLPDNTVVVTQSGDGIRLSGKSNDLQYDEDFDRNMVLTQVLVVSPNIRVLTIPTFSHTPDGLLVSSVTSRFNQPPSAPAVEVTISADYAKVGSFQIPSRIVSGVKNGGRIEFAFSACQVSVADSSRKP